MKMMVKMVYASISLHDVMAMAVSFLPLSPSDAIRRLGFFIQEWFLVAMGI
jgi:hypothetical protein